MSETQILEVWVQPERAMYIPIAPRSIDEHELMSMMNLEKISSFQIQSVDGKEYYFATRNVYFMVLHPAESTPT